MAECSRNESPAGGLRLEQETRARYALNGAFMLAVIAASFAFVYWLENKGGFGQRAYYQLRFDSSVSGLRAVRRCCSTAFAWAR